jgi:hypothetical protein
VTDLRNEFINFHPMHRGLPAVAVSRGVADAGPRLDAAGQQRLVERICRAYAHAQAGHAPDAGSLWTLIESKHLGPFHQALATADHRWLRDHFGHLFTDEITHGIDQNIDMHRAIVADDHALRAYVARCRDMLVRLGEALGVLTIENPEQGTWGENLYAVDIDRLLDAIERRIAIRIAPPRNRPGSHRARHVARQLRREGHPRALRRMALAPAAAARRPRR